MSEGEWSWIFKSPAKRTYDDLDEHTQTRITDKLDDIVNDQWRDPDEYTEPLIRTVVVNYWSFPTPSGR